MNKFRWYYNRLLAMNLSEVMWRVNQKFLSTLERIRFFRAKDPSSNILLPYKGGTRVNPNELKLNPEIFSASFDDVSGFYALLRGENFWDFIGKWNASFTDNASWPMKPSQSLEYRQRDDIGDSRLNWELNRLQVLPGLALSNPQAVDAVLRSWSVQSPFLHGISWTSVMEAALRAIQCIFAAAFLRLRQDALADETATRLETLALNCVLYVDRHHSRFSSANNHLIVEMAAIGIAGVAFGNEKWVKKASDILSEELPRQNSTDGVNLEMSLHYHAFVLEAYLLFCHTMGNVPDNWRGMLRQMARFLSLSLVNQDTSLTFGDDDEGCILNASSDHSGYYRYVLQLASLALNEKFDAFAPVSPTLRWLYQDSRIAQVANADWSPLTGDIAACPVSVTFSDGGYSILRSRDGGTVIAFDHAKPGFGTIAAHAHDDALSIQICHDGRLLLGDPGTFLYHTDLPIRNLLRDSRHHNTLTVADQGQSEMLGAFLWGKKAVVNLEISDLTPDVDTLVATCVGLSGIKHTRELFFDKITPELVVTDHLSASTVYEASFITPPSVRVEKVSDTAICVDNRLRIEFSTGTILLEDTPYSTAYGVLAIGTRISVTSEGSKLITNIKFDPED